jgi:uncharacterized protein YbjT (DUF2867 family)
MPKKNSDRLILVTGATGHQGGAVLRHLHKAGFPVRALTRDPDKPVANELMGSKTEVVRGDLNDRDSLTRALEDVYGVYSVQAVNFADIEAEVREGVNLVDAAARSGISHFVYSSVAGADKNSGIPHFETKFRIEEHLRQSGIPNTILRPAFFMENWIAMRDQLEKGSINFPVRPETHFPMIAVDDIGAAAAKAFEHPGHWQGRAVELAGDDLAIKDIAGIFSRVLSHPVEYRQVPYEQFEKQAGHELTVMFRWFDTGAFHVDIAALRNDIPNLTSFESWLHSQFQPA